MHVNDACANGDQSRSRTQLRYSTDAAAHRHIKAARTHTWRREERREGRREMS